mgnify:CR=1 FL=1
MASLRSRGFTAWSSLRSSFTRSSGSQEFSLLLSPSTLCGSCQISPGDALTPTPPQLLSYVQDHDSTRFSPYLFVFGIFAGPCISSIAYQSALYRVSQLGIEIRVGLADAVFSKVLRTKEGGEGASSDSGSGRTDEKEMESPGSDTVGRVNSELPQVRAHGRWLTSFLLSDLVGTDIDVITSSLVLHKRIWISGAADTTGQNRRSAPCSSWASPRSSSSRSSASTSYWDGVPSSLSAPYSPSPHCPSSCRSGTALFRRRS